MLYDDKCYVATIEFHVPSSMLGWSISMGNVQSTSEILVEVHLADQSVDKFDLKMYFSAYSE